MKQNSASKSEGRRNCRIPLRLSAILVFLLCAALAPAQQITNYVFSTNNTSSLALDRSGNTVDMTTGTTQLIGPSTASAGSGLFNVGFDVYFFGVRYTQISVTSNGLIGMGAALVAGANSFLGGNNRLSISNANGMSATAQGTSPTGKVHYKLIGAAPNRTLVVEWLNMSAINTSGTADFTCQMRLYETSGTIEYVYGNAAIGSSGPQTWNIGISSNTATSYQTVNTSTNTALVNTNYANSYATGTITDLNSAANGSRRSYTWIPTGTTAPTAMNFTAVTSNSMNVNWTDNATDELGYVVYESHDGGVTWNYMTTAAANTVTYAATGLISSTTYMWRVYALREALSTPLQGSQATTAATNVTAIASGLWSQTTTWSTGAIPTSSDNAVIPASFTVTIDMAAVAQFVTVTGTLEYEATTARSLTVGESVTVNAGGTFRSNLTGTQTAHTLTVGRDLINNGTIDFSTNTNTAGAAITFNSVNNGNFTLGATSTTNLRTATENKGTSIATTLTFTPGGTLTVQGGSTLGFLTITNGLFELGGTAAITSPIFASATYTIPATGGFRLNNASAIVSGLTGSCTTNGLLRISQGTYIVGTATDNSMGFGTGSTFTVEGGSITSAGRLQTANAMTVNISGGTINVAAVGSTSTLASFGFTAAVFTMSNGTINLIQASTGVTVDYSVAGTVNITGGTLNVGTSATATNFTFRVQGTTPNMIIDNTTNAKTALASAALQINGNLTVTTGATLNAQANTVIMNGASIAAPGNITNNGVITNTTATGANRLQFSSPFGAQTYSGSGTFGTIALAFSGINVSNAAGITVSSPIITNRVNLFTGTVNNASNITVGFGAASAPTIQVGGTATVAAGSFAAAPTFNVGTGGLTVNYATSLNAVTSGNEIPSPRTVLNLVIGNTPGVTLAGGALTITGTLTLTSGILTTTAANLPTVTATTVASVTGGSATSYVRGPLGRTLPASLVTGSTYTFPVGKSGYNPFEMVNPTTNAGGPVAITAEVFDANSGGTAGAGLFSINTNRYWNATITSGAANFTNTTIRLTETGMGGGSRVGQSATQAGSYSDVGGTVSLNTITSVTPSTSLNYFVIATTSSTLSGTYLVGASQPTYQKLTQVAAALNTSTVTGNVIFEMQSDYDGTTGETFPINFNQYTTTGAFKVTIRPASAATNLTTSGDPGSSNGNIVMNGVDNLTFDGRSGGTGSTIQWTFRNTRTAATVGSTFIFQNDATVDTLKYLRIEGQNTAAANATVFFGTTINPLGNINDVLMANDIRDRSDVAGVPNTAVASSGTAAAPNNTIKLIGNNIHNFTSNGINLVANSNSWTIGGTTAADGNNVYQDAARAAAFTSINVATGNTHTIGFNQIYQTAGINTAAMTGINVSGGGNGIIVRNNGIGGANATHTGAAMISNVGSTSYGISLAVGTTTAAEVYNNRIANWGVLTTSTVGIANGIYVSSGNVNIGTLGGNTLGGAVVTAVASDTLVTSYDNGWINLAGGTVVNVENNIVTNASYYRGANDRNCGIYAATGTTINIRNNTIRALKGNNTSAIGSTFITMGMYCAISGTLVEGNYIDDIYNFNTTAASLAVKGIFWNAGAGTVRNNRIVNIRSSNALTGTSSPTIYGLLIYSGSPAVYNNRVAVGMNSGNESRVYGIYDATTSNPGAAINYNTVYVTGATATGTNTSFAFVRASSAANSLRDNLLYNERTGGGGNYAIGNINATPATNWTATTSNYNYFITGTTNVGLWGTTPSTIVQWRTSSLGDANTNSNDPITLPATTLFVSPSTGNLKIATGFLTQPTDLESKGVAVTGITTDFESDVRPGPAGSIHGGGTAPDIGADEFDGTPLSIDIGITTLVLPATSGCHSNCEIVRVRLHNFNTSTANFAAFPVTITGSVAGPNAVTFTPIVISSGTLAANGNLDTALTICYNMTATGTYVFSASASATGDGNPSNNSMTSVSVLIGGGTATISPSPLCLGASTTLTLSNYTNGGTIQWQSSPDNITWTNIPSATTPSYGTTPTDTTFYRAVVCGTNNSVGDTAITIDIQPAVTTNGTRCGPGSVALSASGSGNLSWYTTSTGGSPIATGTTYTPNITGTTTYYVENSYQSCGASSVPATPTCYPIYSNACSSNDYINNFSTTGGSTNITNNNSGCNGAGPNNTTFFSSQSVTCAPGSSFNLSVQAGTAFSQGFRMWIDFNNDGDFADLGENVWASATANTVVNTGTVTVPPATTPGPKRIRLMCRYITVPAATDYCLTTASFGEVEEYTLNVCQLCTATRTAVTATVTAPPSINLTAGNQSLCGSDTTVLSVSSSNSTYAYTWSPSANLSATTGSSVTFAPTNPGNYTYYVDAYDAGSGCANRDTIGLSLSPRPTFTLGTTNDTVCSGSSTTIYVVPPASTVQINNGNTLNTSTSYPAPYGQFYGGSRHQMLYLASELAAAGMTAGYYDGLTFQVTNTNASASLINFTVSLGYTTAPDLSAGFVTVPMTTVYTNALYAPSVGVNTHAFSAPFYYDGVSNLIVETCFANYTTFPNTTFTTNCTMRQTATSFTSCAYNRYDNTANICSIAYQFTANQRPNVAFLRSTSSWSFAWSPTSTLVTPTNDTTVANPTSTTTYYMTVTDGLSGCTKLDSITIHVNPLPPVALGNDTLICSGDVLQLAGPAGSYSYLWQDSSVAMTFGANAVGQYNVLVTDSATGCFKSDTINIGVNQRPSFTLGADATVCQGNSVTFSGPSGTFDYLWDIGSLTQNIVVDSTHSYMLTVTDTTTQCFSMDTVMLTVNPLPPTNLGNDTSLCSVNAPYILYAASGTNYTNTWSDMSTLDSLVVTSTNNYYVTTVDTTTGCVKMDTVAVQVNPTPFVSLGNDSTQCGGSITLNAPGGPFDYLWNGSSTTSTFTASSTMQVNLLVTDSITGCASMDTVNLTINTVPTFTLGNDTSICGTLYTVYAPAGPYSYQWSNSTTGNSYDVLTTSSPSLLVTDTTSGCTFADTISVAINTPPTATFTFSQDTICIQDAPLSIVGSPSGGTFSGPGVSGSTFNASSLVAGNYTVTYMYTATNGCADTTNDFIIVSGCVGIEEHSLAAQLGIYPNPNNGKFTLTISNADYKEISMQVYTLEGKIIYSDMASDVKGNYSRVLDLSTFANGTYYLKINADGQLSVKKVFKQD